jgi:hypothetical protein
LLIPNLNDTGTGLLLTYELIVDSLSFVNRTSTRMCPCTHRKESTSSNATDTSYETGRVLKWSMRESWGRVDLYKNE